MDKVVSSVIGLALQNVFGDVDTRFVVKAPDHDYYLGGPDYEAIGGDASERVKFNPRHHRNNNGGHINRLRKR